MSFALFGLVYYGVNLGNRVLVNLGPFLFAIGFKTLFLTFDKKTSFVKQKRYIKDPVI